VQQQIDEGAVVVIAQVVGLAVAALHQFFQPGAVLAVIGAVADHRAAGRQQGDTAQFRQRALQRARQGLLLFDVARRLDHR